jgi:hypothetical protein
MLAMKWLLMAAGFLMFGTAAGVVAYDVYLAMQFQKLMGSGKPGAGEKAGPRRPLFWQAPSGARTRRWSLAARLFGWAWAPLPLAMSLAVIPKGSGEVHIRQISGLPPGAL